LAIGCLESRLKGRDWHYLAGRSISRGQTLDEFEERRRDGDRKKTSRPRGRHVKHGPSFIHSPCFPRTYDVIASSMLREYDHDAVVLAPLHAVHRRCEESLRGRFGTKLQREPFLLRQELLWRALEDSTKGWTEFVK
jgi:hypothetical protein